MERLQELPQQEKFKHFDLLASIDLLRFDLMNEGAVRSETMQRVYDEELSYVAEGIDRPAQTIFALREINGQFVYFSEGEWQPYMSMLTKGIRSAQAEAEKDSRKSFLVDMAAEDYLVAQRWHQLSPGEKMHWYSPYREREHQLYGEKFMNSLGFQSKRRMGFLYQAERDYEGNLILTSMTVDNSDEEAFSAAMHEAKVSKDISQAMEAYDRVLTFKYGQVHRAGRLRENEENAWEIIQKHDDLVNYYFEKLEDLAGNYLLTRTELEIEKKRLTYGFWATIKERMDKALRGPVDSGFMDKPTALAQEMAMAYAKLQAKGEILFGCGGSITPEDPLLGADAQDVFDSIFGKTTGEDKYGSLTFKCPKKGCLNKREHGKLLTHCQKCGAEVSCG